MDTAMQLIPVASVLNVIQKATNLPEQQNAKLHQILSVWP